MVKNGLSCHGFHSNCNFLYSDEIQTGKISAYDEPMLVITYMCGRDCKEILVTNF